HSDVWDQPEVFSEEKANYDEALAVHLRRPCDAVSLLNDGQHVRADCGAVYIKSDRGGIKIERIGIVFGYEMLLRAIAGCVQPLARTRFWLEALNDEIVFARQDYDTVGKWPEFTETELPLPLEASGLIEGDIEEALTQITRADGLSLWSRLNTFHYNASATVLSSKQL